MNDLEKEIEESRARLDDTIDRIQGRLSVPNLVDEMLGNARRVPALNTTYDSALEAVRRNPVCRSKTTRVVAFGRAVKARASSFLPTATCSPTHTSSTVPKKSPCG